MKRPERVVLQGRHVKIVPLHAATHAAALITPVMFYLLRKPRRQSVTQTLNNSSPS